MEQSRSAVAQADGGLRLARSSVRPWALVGFLCLLYALSSVDRLILVLLVDPIAQSVGVTDTQISVLVGIGFAAAYVLMGLPAAHIVDQGRRRWLLASGVGLWSLGTITSAFAGSYTALVYSRVGVAIGEAVLTPVAISLIAELFPRERRSAPTSLFVATGVLMGAGALLVGGAAAQFAAVLSPRLGLEAWRTTLLLVGAPGILLAFIAGWVTPDQVQRPKDLEEGASVRAALRYLRREGRAFLPFFIGVGCLSAISLGLVVWAPTLLVRTHGYSASQAGYVLGLIGMPTSVIGTMAAPRLAHWLLRCGNRHAVTLVAGSSALLGAGVLSAGLLSRDLNLLLGAVGISVCALAGATVLPAIVVQWACPQALRARMMALNLLCLNILGLGLGPFAMAQATRIHGDGDIAAGICIVTLAALASAIMSFLYGARALAARTVESARQANGNT